MTPEEARRLLERFDEETSATEDQNRAVWLWGEMQVQIMKGPRAAELSALHTAATIAERTQAPDAADLRDKHEQLLDTLYDEITAKLDADLAEGKEAPWAKWPK